VAPKPSTFYLKLTELIPVRSVENLQLPLERFSPPADRDPAGGKECSIGRSTR
jgi:hypothetical protein